MKDTALRIARSAHDPGTALNLLREYLQAMTLRSLHEAGALGELSFIGGTALRFLHELPRFSEDLDFSWEAGSIESGSLDGSSLALKLRRDLERQGFEVDVRWKGERTVQLGWVRVAGLLHELGLAGAPQQKIGIKIEVDTDAPAGAGIESSLLRRHAFIAVRHHDLASLFAGKVRAALTRPFTKGRDWYDLMWYLTRRPAVAPNLVLLRNALKVEPGQALTGAAFDWQSALATAANESDFDLVQRDVLPFLEVPGDAQFLTRDHMLSLIERHS